MKEKVSVILFTLFITHSCAQVTDNSTTISNEIKTQSSEVGGYQSCGANHECVPIHLCTTDKHIFFHRFIGRICKRTEVCCDISNKRTFRKEPVEGCGWRGINAVEFEVYADTDNESHLSEFPWMVAILRIEYIAGEVIKLYDCGGTLIAPNAVLTASHCVIHRQANQLAVRAGEWNIKYDNAIFNNVDSNVMEIIIHEKYNKRALFNDVALLILKESFKWQKNIIPICLPKRYVNLDHRRCYVTAWSKDESNLESKNKYILQKIDLPVVPHDTCQNYLRKTRLGKHFQLHESFLCAGGEYEKDACGNDGGSALVCAIPGAQDRYYQAGIVAWGIGCGAENVPGVYANISQLRPWILEKLAAKDIQFAHFTP